MTVTSEQQILARARDLADLGEVADEITTILSRARAAGADRVAVASIGAAARALAEPGDDWVAQAMKGEGKDEYPTDVPMFEDLRSADDELIHMQHLVGELYDQADTALRRAAVAEAAVAAAEPAARAGEPAGIAEIESQLSEAQARIRMMTEAAELLREAHRKIGDAIRALRRVPDEYENTYAESLALIRSGGTLPNRTEFLTPHGSHLAHRTLSNRAAEMIKAGAK